MVDSFFGALPEYIELLMGYVPAFIIIAYRKTQNETEKAKKTAGLPGLRYINVVEEMKKSKRYSNNTNHWNCDSKEDAF